MFVSSPTFAYAARSSASSLGSVGLRFCACSRSATARLRSPPCSSSAFAASRSARVAARSSGTTAAALLARVGVAAPVVAAFTQRRRLRRALSGSSGASATACSSVCTASARRPASASSAPSCAQQARAIRGWIRRDGFGDAGAAAPRPRCARRSACPAGERLHELARASRHRRAEVRERAQRHGIARGQPRLGSDARCTVQRERFFASVSASATSSRSAWRSYRSPSSVKRPSCV